MAARGYRRDTLERSDQGSGVPVFSGDGWSQNCDRDRSKDDFSLWSGSADDYKFFNAAFLFHEPMRLAAGETLRLRYRVLIHDGGADPADLDRIAADFAAGRPARLNA